MALTIEFSRRSTQQLQKIFTFYDERNGDNLYSRRLLQTLLEDLQRIAQMPLIGSPSTRSDVRFFYMLGFTVIYRYNTRKLSVLSIRSSAQRPLKFYKKSN